jgi:hypothetical protein
MGLRFGDRHERGAEGRSGHVASLAVTEDEENKATATAVMEPEPADDYGAALCRVTIKPRSRRVFWSCGKHDLYR